MGYPGVEFCVIEMTDVVVGVVVDFSSHVWSLQSKRRETWSEASLMRSVSHPNIVRFYDAFTDRQQLHIVMEYAPHGDLHVMIKNAKKKKKLLSADFLWRSTSQVGSK